MSVVIRKGTLSDAISSVPTIDIVEAFDVPYQKRNGKIYLLCPGHEDKHFGSCYIDRKDNGYYCYACGEHVNKWHMLLKLNNNNKKAAYQWFFEHSGLTPETYHEDDPYQKAIQLIRKLEPYVRNNVVYNDIYECSKRSSSYGRTSKGEYLYSEPVVTNPLLDTYKINLATFKKITTDVIHKRLERLTRMVEIYGRKNKNEIIDNPCKISYEELTFACQRMIEELEELKIDIDNL